MTKHTTLVSTRALLLVLENIENNADLDHKSQIPSKPKGVEEKCKMESSDYHIPKKACQELVHWKLPEKQGENTACYATSMEGQSKATIHATVIISTKTAP